MSLITPEQFRPSWTQAQVDQYINEMPVPALNFAVMSSLFHRFYGVLNGSNDGERQAVQDPGIDNTSMTPDRYILNACARYAYPRIANSVLSELESVVGYHLTPRYVTETIPFQSSHHKLISQYPGVERLNVGRVWTTLPDLQEVEVYPFVQELTTADNTVVYPFGDGGLTPAARVSDQLVKNPNDVIIRNESGAIFPWFSDSGHMLSRTLGSYWQLPLAVNRRAYSGEDLLVQHKKFVYVDILAPTLPTGATIYPVYPGSTQIIPQAKPMQIVIDGDDTLWRFWFYVYTLVHPDFVSETVDLQVGEFYKLYPFISFKYAMDTTVDPQLVVTYGDEEIVLTPDEDTAYPKLTLVNQAYGIFHFNYDSCANFIDRWCKCHDTPETIMLRYSYKTNPDFLPDRYKNQIGRLLDAAAARIAADLPTEDCGCDVPWGFIKEKKGALPHQTFSDVSGNVIDRFRYGTAFGQLEYANMLANAARYSRPVELRIKS